MHLVDEQRRVEHEHDAEADEQHLRAEVGDGEEQVQLGRLAEPADVQRGEQRDRDEAADDVAGVVRQRREEGAEVVRHEERRDGDRDDVVELSAQPAKNETTSLKAWRANEEEPPASGNIAAPSA